MDTVNACTPDNPGLGVMAKVVDPRTFFARRRDACELQHALNVVFATLDSMRPPLADRNR